MASPLKVDLSTQVMKFIDIYVLLCSATERNRERTNVIDQFLPLLRRFNPAEPVVEKSVIL